MPEHDLATTFLGWTALRAVLHRGWWLVTSLYLVVVADLSPSQLVLYGTAMSVTMLLGEIPTGVVADTMGRKRSLVIAHLVMGSGMVLMGLVTAFPLLLLTQVLWGLGWTFSSGADVAWVTDELNEPGRIGSVLIARARWELVGAAGGMVGFALLAWSTSLPVAIVIAGAGMIALGLLVALRFTEHNFTPTREHRWRASASIFRRGVTLARRDEQIMVVLAATFLINGAAQGSEFLVPKRLIGLGLPQEPDPIVWLSLLGLSALALGALALWGVQSRIDGVGLARAFYAAAALVGCLALLVVALAPGVEVGIAGVLLVSGIAWPVTRAVSVVWVNRRATSEVRATVHSFLSQAEAFGEICAGVVVAVIARAWGIEAAFVAASVLAACAGLLVVSAHASRRAA